MPDIRTSYMGQELRRFIAGYLALLPLKKASAEIDKRFARLSRTAQLSARSETPGLSVLDEFHPTVLGAAILRVIRGNRFVRAETG